MRTDVAFDVAGSLVRGWFWAPEAAAALPAVVMAHGLGCTRGMRADAFAERFAGAGYAVLLFDYRSFGASEGHPRDVVDIAAQRRDWAGAVEWVRARPEVAPDRVALWGTSLSAGHVLVHAAHDPRVAAVVAQVPFTSGIASALAGHPVSTLRLVPAIAGDVAARLLRRPPVRVPTGAAPGRAALLSSPEAEPGYQRFDHPVPQVGASAGLDIMVRAPGRAARHVQCPILFVVGDRDTTTPPGPTLRYAARAPRAEVRRYDVGHFDPYFGECFEQVSADELAFLRRVLPVPDDGRPHPASG